MITSNHSLIKFHTFLNHSTLTFPRYASAVSFILSRTMELISSGKNVLSSPLNSTFTRGLPSSLITSKGQCFMSICTVSSSNLRPMRRLASVGKLARVCVRTLIVWQRGQRSWSYQIKTDLTSSGIF